MISDFALSVTFKISAKLDVRKLWGVSQKKKKIKINRNMEDENVIKVMSVEELNESMKRFGFADYAVFCVMLLCCSMVGLYFGYQDHMKHKRE